MAEVIQDLKQEKTKATVDIANSANHDLLYQRLDHQIIQQTEAILHLLQLIPPYPTGKAELLQEMEHEFSAQTQFYQKNLAQLQFLESELNVLPLNLRLQAIEEKLSRYEQAIYKSYQLKETQETIETQIQWVTNSLQKNENLTETDKNNLLDYCDKIADQLDALSEQGYDILSLEASYHQLLLLVEHFQDMLDDSF